MISPNTKTFYIRYEKNTAARLDCKSTDGEGETPSNLPALADYAFVPGWEAKNDKIITNLCNANNSNLLIGLVCADSLSEMSFL